MDFRLTTLGVSSASPMPGRYPSAHVLNVHGRLFLIDGGEGAQMLLARHGISHFKISDICLSHLHGDHVFGLFGLLSTMSLKGRTAPLNIYAPSGFSSIMDFFLKQFGEGILYDIRHIPIDCGDMRLITESEHMEMYAFPLKHSVPSWGFLFREKELPRNVNKAAVSELKLTVSEILELKGGRDVVRDDGSLLSMNALTYSPAGGASFAYCCDTAPFSRETEYLRGVNLVLHETTFAADMKEMAARTGHTTTVQAAAIAREAGIGKLVITHFSSRYPNPQVLLEEVKRDFENVFLASEGETFEI